MLVNNFVAVLSSTSKELGTGATQVDQSALITYPVADQSSISDASNKEQVDVGELALSPTADFVVVSPSDSFGDPSPAMSQHRTKPGHLESSASEGTSDSSARMSLASYQVSPVADDGETKYYSMLDDSVHMDLSVINRSADDSQRGLIYSRESHYSEPAVTKNSPPIQVSSRTKMPLPAFVSSPTRTSDVENLPQDLGKLVLDKNGGNLGKNKNHSNDYTFEDEELAKRLRTDAGVVAVMKNDDGQNNKGVEQEEHVTNEYQAAVEGQLNDGSVLNDRDSSLSSSDIFVVTKGSDEDKNESQNDSVNETNGNGLFNREKTPSQNDSDDRSPVDSLDDGGYRDRRSPENDESVQDHSVNMAKTSANGEEQEDEQNTTSSSVQEDANQVYDESAVSVLEDANTEDESNIFFQTEDKGLDTEGQGEMIAGNKPEVRVEKSKIPTSHEYETRSKSSKKRNESIQCTETSVSRSGDSQTSISGSSNEPKVIYARF